MPQCWLPENEQRFYDSVVHGLRSQGWTRIEAEGEALERILKRRTTPVNSYDRALMDMAIAYGLGTPESRAIVTAMDHARAITPDRSGEADKTGTGSAEGESVVAAKRSSKPCP